MTFKRIFFLPVISLVSLPVIWCQVIFQSSNLPILRIYTEGQTIVDEVKIPAKMQLLAKDLPAINHIDDRDFHYDGPIGIELRGSTSQFYAKKAYGLELRTTEGKNQDFPLLGMPEENDWALISPLNDKSLLRDALAHHFAAAVLPWAPRFRFVEVLLNEKYEGVYLLIETIKRDANRVNINNLKTDEISGDDLTGGYLLRMDKFGPPPGVVGGDWKSVYPPQPGAWQETWFQYREPKADEITSEQKTYIQRHLLEFEEMLAADDYANHYQEWIDLDTWVDYLLLQELVKNTDAYRLSAYFYKHRDSDGGKLGMGPAWDFNIAFGLGDYCEGQSYMGWVKDYNRRCPDDPWLIHFWWDRLFEETGFRQRMVERWQNHRAGVWSNERLFATLDSFKLKLDAAQARNFQRWPVLGEYIWPNAFVGRTYQDEIHYLQNWFTKRLIWLDENIPLLSVNTNENTNPVQWHIYPNPTAKGLFLEWDKGRENYFHPFKLEIFEQTGRLVLTESQISYENPIYFDLPTLPGGIYYVRISGETIPPYMSKIIRQ